MGATVQAQMEATSGKAVETRAVDGVEATVSYERESDARVTDREVRAYIDRGNAQHPNALVDRIDLAVDGDEVGITYHFSARPFDRIRRITGYLVGTLDRFNDAKRAEERDRVKHGVPAA